MFVKQFVLLYMSVSHLSGRYRRRKYNLRVFKASSLRVHSHKFNRNAKIAHDVHYARCIQENNISQKQMG